MCSRILSIHLIHIELLLYVVLGIVEMDEGDKIYSPVRKPKFNWVGCIGYLGTKKIVLNFSQELFCGANLTEEVDA